MSPKVEQSHSFDSENRLHGPTFEPKPKPRGVWRASDLSLFARPDCPQGSART